MFGWVQLLLGVVTLAHEFVKYVREQEETKQKRMEKVKEVKDAIRTARKSNDTTKIETLLSDVVNRRS